MLRLGEEELLTHAERVKTKLFRVCVRCVIFLLEHELEFLVLVILNVVET
jgi:hypothetical protein